LSLFVSGLSGLLVFLLLHLLLVVKWSWFMAVPWPGYELATARGIVEPWFVHTPRSLWVTRAAFFMLAMVTVWLRTGARSANAFAIWLGAGIGVALAYATTSLPSLEWGWLGFLLYPLRLVLPVLLGAAAGTVGARVRARRVA
jgi:hypothetical protein